jgi:hypothetical protein
MHDAGNKCMMLERGSSTRTVPKAVEARAYVARMATALAFPTVAVAVKRVTGTSRNGGFAM